MTGHRHVFETYWQVPEAVQRRCECGEVEEIATRCQGTNVQRDPGRQCLRRATWASKCDGTEIHRLACHYHRLQFRGLVEVGPGVETEPS